MAPDTRIPQLYGVLIPCTVITIVVVALRLYVRIRLLNNFASDDKWIVAAAIVNTALNCLSLVQTKYGGGWRFATIPPELFEELLKQAFFVCLLGLITPTLIKISILALYTRLSQEASHKRIIQIIMWFTIIATLALAFAQIFNCHPVSAAWDVTTYPRLCTTSPITLLLIHCVMNAFTDCIVFFLPIPVILGLTNISRYERIIVAIILPLGGISVVASIVRMVFYVEMVRQWPEGDITWMSANNTIWGAVEMAMAIIACSMFALRQLCSREAKENKRRKSVVVPKENTQMHHGVELWSYVSVQEEGTMETGRSDDKLVNSTRVTLERTSTDDIRPAPPH